jgi:hypothetical protein
MSADETLSHVTRLLSLLPGVKLAWIQKSAAVVRLGLAIEDVRSLAILGHIVVAANVPMHVEVAWDCPGKCDKPDCVRYDWRIPIESDAFTPPSNMQLVGGMIARKLAEKGLLPQDEADQLLRAWNFWVQ